MPVSMVFSQLGTPDADAGGDRLQIMFVSDRTE
jgi:hypothetical protein